MLALPLRSWPIKGAFQSPTDIVSSFGPWGNVEERRTLARSDAIAHLGVWIHVPESRSTVFVQAICTIELQWSYEKEKQERRKEKVQQTSNDTHASPPPNEKCLGKSPTTINLALKQTWVTSIQYHQSHLTKPISSFPFDFSDE